MSHVTLDRPVHGRELEQIDEAQGVSVEAGGASLVYKERASTVGARVPPENDALRASRAPIAAGNERS